MDMIGGVESALWEGCYPASALAMGLCDSLCLVLLCGGRYGLGDVVWFFSSFWDRVWAE